ncbi:type IV pilus twitching motility protein PilT [Fidelibacter multiformis]|uniref:type IV pilus twitching motility protein PilT n=1 Tax=Fidelibacter multiformis TaxID=3377529 RepID=UPI0037DD1E0B
MATEIYTLLKFAVDNGASDLHLCVGSPPIVRVDGDMLRTNLDPMDSTTIHSLVYDVMSDEQRKLFETNWEIDFSREFKGIGRFRVNVYRDINGEAAVFRMIPTKVLSFKELGLPDVLLNIASQDKGLVLVTGPTGSGKSTTLATIIDFINKKYKKHIITVEDPVEFVHVSDESLVNQREVGFNTKSFAAALRSALREDPDVILVGEMRDLETTSLAITAAETGHLVFGTLHTNNAAKTIDRVIDQYPATQQAQIRSMLSESLLAVVSQVLLKHASGRGRVAAFEIMIGTSGIRNLIRESKVFQIPSAIQTGSNVGMVSLDQSLVRLAEAGKIDTNIAIQSATNPGYVKKNLGLE